MTTPLLNTTSLKFDGKEIEGVADFSFETPHDCLSDLPHNGTRHVIVSCTGKSKAMEVLRQMCIDSDHETVIKHNAVIDRTAMVASPGRFSYQEIADKKNSLFHTGESIQEKANEMQIFIDDVKHMEDVQRKFMERQPKQKRTDLKLNACRRQRGKR